MAHALVRVRRKPAFEDMPRPRVPFVAVEPVAEDANQIDVFADVALGFETVLTGARDAELDQLTGFYLAQCIALLGKELTQMRPHARDEIGMGGFGQLVPGGIAYRQHSPNPETAWICASPGACKRQTQPYTLVSVSAEKPVSKNRKTRRATVG